MTLEEFIREKNPAGRMITTENPDGFTFRATIRTAGRWDPGEVCFFLAEVSRRYRTSELPWTKVGDCKIVVAAATPAENGANGTVSFALPGGGRASISPKGQKLPATAEKRDE
jgi:hypothetical protein